MAINPFCLDDVQKTQKHPQLSAITGLQLFIDVGPVTAIGCGEPGIDCFSIRGSGWFYSGYSGFHPFRDKKRKERKENKKKRKKKKREKEKQFKRKAIANEKDW